jgi:hypothetical protein
MSILNQIVCQQIEEHSHHTVQNVFHNHHIDRSDDSGGKFGQIV